MRQVTTTVQIILGCVGIAAGLASAQEPAMRPVLRAPDQEGYGVAAPAIACFAPGTDPRYVEAVNGIVDQLNSLRLGADYQLNSRWSGAQGTPRSLTWSFVPDGVLLGSGAGEPNAASNLFSKMDSAFASQGGRATWVNRYAQIFARWQALSGVTYTRVTVSGTDWDDGAAFPGSGSAAGLRGDCRCGGHSIDGVSGILAYCYFPSTGDCVLDTDDAASNFASTGNQNRFLRNTVGHEFGHGLGLNHVDPVPPAAGGNTKLMEAYLSTAFDGPQQDDIRAIQRHYGDPYESNDTAATAKPLGAIVQGSPITFGTVPASPSGSVPANAALLSIDADGKSDYWSFTVNQPVNLTATVTPIGTTYPQGPQGGTVTSDNALAQANLAIDVISSNGSTVLSSNTGAGLGVAESASGVALPDAGAYYLRIYETNTPTECQLYQLNLSVTNSTPICPTIDTQPTPVTACSGAWVALVCIASGSPTPTLQWRKNGVNIPGATGQVYSALSATSVFSGTYDCIATNTCGSTPSDAVDVVIIAPPSVGTSPSSQTIAAGNPVTFTVSASGTTPLIYQWRKDTNPISGANGPSYTIPSVQVSDAGAYDCRIDNDCGTAISDPATLTVSGSSCYANCDQSTSVPVLNANDFQCFLNSFAAGDSYANCDGSTSTPVLNANDFQCFLNQFASGCP